MFLPPFILGGIAWNLSYPLIETARNLHQHPQPSEEEEEEGKPDVSDEDHEIGSDTEPRAE